MATDDEGKAGTPPAAPPAAAAAPPSAAAAKVPDPTPFIERYDVAGWKERAKRRFGVSPHAVAGAFHDAKPCDTFTEDEVQMRLQFLKVPLS